MHFNEQDLMKALFWGVKKMVEYSRVDLRQREHMEGGEVWQPPTRFVSIFQNLCPR